MRRAPEALIVEFLGLPGVGKSAVSERTAGLLRDRFRVHEPIRELSDRSRARTALSGAAGKAWRVAAELLRHPFRSARAIGIIRRSGQPSALAALRIGFNWLLQSSVSEAPSHGATIRFLDEGLFQALWSMGLQGPEGVVRVAGPALLEAVGGPDIVVVVHAEADPIALRLAARNGHSSRADRWGSADTEIFARAIALLGEVETLLPAPRASLQLPRVIRVENGPGRNPVEVAYRVAGEIERFVRTIPHTAFRRDLQRLTTRHVL